MWGRKSFVRWLFVTTALVAGGLVAGHVSMERVLPLGIAMAPLDGSEAVDPRNPVRIRAVGLGARLAEVKAYDSSGQLVAEALDQRKFTLTGPLDFGTRYRFIATVERLWTGQRLTRELALTTVEKPSLEGPADRMLEADGSVTLHFDRPVGRLEAVGPMTLKVELDETRQSIRLMSVAHPQGQTFPVQLNWNTTTGVPLPPLHLSVTTPPALTAEVSPRDLTNVGLALPIQITFSEPVADRDNVGRHVSVQTQDGVILAGKWSWVGKTRLQFKPQPGWPASSTIEVSVDPLYLRSVRGGALTQPVVSRFATGTDRRIYVYLDAQRMAAVENGAVVKTFKVSTGKDKTPTVAGSFYIYARFPIKTMRSRAKPGEPGHYVVENVPYAQYFHADYAFHGAWWHNAFGRPASHGCVNMSTRRHNKRWPGVPEDAGWLYQWASLGVPVTVFRSTPAQQLAMQ